MVKYSILQEHKTFYIIIWSNGMLVPIKRKSQLFTRKIYRNIKMLDVDIYSSKIKLLRADKVTNDGDYL